VKRLKKIWSYYNKAEEYLLVGSLMVTVGIVSLQVIFRYILNNSLSWSEELTRYIFIWQIWLGTSIAMREDRHLKVEFLYNMMGPKNRKILTIFSKTVLLLFCLFLTINGGQLVLALQERHSLSTALRIPLYLVYASLPFSCFMMVLRLIPQTIELIKSPDREKGETA
jgi:C4-dicarboxylate transporter DctQ subunit